MHGQLVHRNVIGRVFRVCPPQHGVGRGMENVLRVGSGEVGGEGYVERVVYRGIGHLGSSNRRDSLGSRLGVRSDAWHAHGVGAPRYAEVGAHPFGPVTHVCQFVHGRPRFAKSARVSEGIQNKKQKKSREERERARLGTVGMGGGRVDAERERAENGWLRLPGIFEKE